MAAGTRGKPFLLSAFLLILAAAWLAGSVLIWWVAAGPFTVLSTVKNPSIAEKFREIPEARRAQVLRHAAGEINRRLFRGWNVAQLSGGLVLLILLAAGRWRGAHFGVFGLFAVLSFLLVVSHAFWMAPVIETLGRSLDFADRALLAESVRRFGWYHRAYVISDMVKAGLLLAGLSLLLRRGAG
ncbi:MAG: DUF4149 domain-containing protein [bacterium]|nr:DUF4149 domain-containing protein [bacterium]